MYSATVRLVMALNMCRWANQSMDGVHAIHALPIRSYQLKLLFCTNREAVDDCLRVGFNEKVLDLPKKLPPLFGIAGGNKNSHHAGIVKAENHPLPTLDICHQKMPQMLPCLDESQLGA